MKIVREKFEFLDYNRMKKELKKNWKSTIIIEKWKESLSENQRKYYFSVVIWTISKDLQRDWYTLEEIHQEIKIQYLPEYEMILQELSDKSDPIEMMRKFLSIYHDLTITTSTKWEFESFLNRIRLWESKKGIYIPLPNEWNWWQGAELVK